MLIRTHLAVTLMAVLFLIDKVNYPYIFVPIIILATFIPDIDTAYSRLGKNRIFRPLQVFVRHRGFIHSFSFLFLLILILILIYPVTALPFFIGYGLHLFLDSFSIEGIKLFYPWGRTSSGKIKTGGKIEVALFFILIIIDLFLIMAKFSNLF